MLHRRPICYRRKTFHRSYSWPIVPCWFRRILGSMYFWRSSPNFLTDRVHRSTLPRRKAWRFLSSTLRLPESPNFNRLICHQSLHYRWVQRNWRYDYKIRFSCSKINCRYQQTSHNLDRFYFHGYRAFPTWRARWICALSPWNFSLQRDYWSPYLIYVSKHQS